MKYIAMATSVFLGFSLAGCGTTGSVAMTIPSTTQQSFTYADERPANERQSRHTVTGAGENTFYADDNLSPPPAEMLRRTFVNRASDALKGRNVTLTEFDVHVTEPEVSVDRHASAALGIAPSNVPILGIESIRSYKTVTVEIRGKIDGSAFFAYHSDEFQGRVTEGDIRSVIQMALDSAIEDAQRVAKQGTVSGGRSAH